MSESTSAPLDCQSQYKLYYDTAKFWGEAEERVSNCIIYVRNNTRLDANFVDLVVLALRSAENMCDHRKKVMTDKAKAFEVLLDENV